jgi:hypothetical protein
MAGNDKCPRCSVLVLEGQWAMDKKARQWVCSPCCKDNCENIHMQIIAKPPRTAAQAATRCAGCKERIVAGQKICLPRHLM